MEVEVNLWAVLLAAVTAMVIGFVWYAKPVFGSTWMKLIGMSEQKAKEASGIAMLWAVLSSLLTAYVLAHVIYLSNVFYEQDFLESALMTAVWVWLGFFLTTAVMHDGFEQRRKKLTAINAGNSLVTLLAMALVIGLMGV